MESNALLPQAARQRGARSALAARTSGGPALDPPVMMRLVPPSSRAARAAAEALKRDRARADREWRDAWKRCDAHPAHASMACQQDVTACSRWRRRSGIAAMDCECGCWWASGHTLHLLLVESLSNEGPTLETLSLGDFVVASPPFRLITV